MSKENSVHQGEVLMLLVKRSGLEGLEVSKRMGINQSYLSKLYKSASLTHKVRISAARVLGVDISVFDDGLGYAYPSGVEAPLREPDQVYDAIDAEIERLKDENARLASELLREREMSDDLRALLKILAAKG